MATQAETRFNDYVVKDLGLADFGRKEIEIAETEMPGLMALRAGIRRVEAAEGRADHRVAAHDDPDRGADRDADRAWRRSALGDRATSFRRRTMRPRRSPRAASRCSRSRARRSRIIGTMRRASSTGARTDLQHDPRRRRRRDHVRFVGRAGRGGRGAVRRRRTRKRRSSSRRCKRFLAERPGYLTKTVEAIKGVSEETTTGVHRLYELAKTGQAPVPGDQRQRQRDQVEVRQPLRLPREPGRRDPPRDRRDARRQGRLRRRLRRRRQGSARSRCATAARACW